MSSWRRAALIEPAEMSAAFWASSGLIFLLLTIHSATELLSSRFTSIGWQRE
ncbi:MAG: hypothetical protein K2K88_00985 [Muribaculaceae bacterium]|nr:hypothetical protein [Muribaculaceae bacterium]